MVLLDGKSIRKQKDYQRYAIMGRVYQNPSLGTSPNLTMLDRLNQAVNCHIIASGGVGKLEHFAEGIIEGEADAVLAASVFHFGELSVRQVKEHMRAQGIPVRL